MKHRLEVETFTERLLKQTVEIDLNLVFDVSSSTTLNKGKPRIQGVPKKTVILV